MLAKQLLAFLLSVAKSKLVFKELIKELFIPCVKVEFPHVRKIQTIKFLPIKQNFLNTGQAKNVPNILMLNPNAIKHAR
jgi:hypothetical protein